MVFRIGDLRADRGCVEQLTVVGVGLDQAALDAAFQRGGNQQTEHNGHVSCNESQPR